jgi:hypothetical protein
MLKKWGNKLVCFNVKNSIQIVSKPNQMGLYTRSNVAPRLTAKNKPRTDFFISQTL